MEFQQLSNLAVDARYGGREIFEKCPHLKLATEVVSRNESFSQLMYQAGHTFGHGRDDGGEIVISNLTPSSVEDAEESAEESAQETVDERDASEDGAFTEAR